MNRTDVNCKTCGTRFTVTADDIYVGVNKNALTKETFPAVKCPHCNTEHTVTLIKSRI